MPENTVKSTPVRVTHKTVDNSVNISLKSSQNVDRLHLLMVLNKN